MTDKMDRASIIEHAVSIGFDPEEIMKLPTYAIFQKVGAMKTFSKEIIQDNTDAETVIDMPLGESIADSKYLRFQFLSKTQQTLTEAIQANSSALSKCSNEFEEDDIVVLRKEIDSASTYLRLIEPELASLKSWFSGQQAQKLDFYKNIAPTLIDTSGELTTHFRNKITTLDHQLKSLNLDKKS
jgi:hypothetical protein